MKKLAVALVAFVFATPVVAPAQDIAPPVKRKSVASAPAASPQSVAPSTTPAAPRQAARPGSERDYIAALTAAAGQGGNAALDTSLIRVMSRLVAAGRCGEAASLAARDGRKELASRAQQLCK